jgi:hypothetical protein
MENDDLAAFDRADQASNPHPETNCYRCSPKRIDH